MTSLQASRTLVKSTPELWAELSELESLARHLGEFGEIRITQVDPESRVEWEADRASGTVRLEPSGWGTRVVLTVDTPEAAPEAALPEPEPEPVAVEPEPEPEPEPGPVAVEPEPEPDPEPVVVEPEPVVVEPAPARRRRRTKRGWFARLFRRTPPPPPAPVEPPAPAVEAEAPVTVEEPVPEAPEPTPAESAFGTIEWETPEAPVEEEPEPPPLRPDEAHALLTDVLDTLGAAHHRPFSRS
jgi:hypothetical protein